MITFSQFCRYFRQNRQYIPAARAADIKREASDRCVERIRAGRADSVLDFRDLVERMENAIAPR